MYFEAIDLAIDITSIEMRFSIDLKYLNCLSFKNKPNSQIYINGHMQDTILCKRQYDFHQVGSTYTKYNQLILHDFYVG